MTDSPIASDNYAARFLAGQSSFPPNLPARGQRHPLLPGDRETARDLTITVDACQGASIEYRI